MIKVHHLDYSRSTRILWLLEELGEPYELTTYHRDPSTFRAPAELKQAHPLGKSPVIEHDGAVIAESGAILEYLAAKLGDGRLGRSPADADWAEYLEWLHAGEGTAMMGVVMLMLVRGSDKTSHASAYGLEVVDGAMAEIEAKLDGRDYLLASGFSAADIQFGYVVAVADQFGAVGDRPRLRAWLARVTVRPAYIAAVEKGGPWLLPISR